MPYSVGGEPCGELALGDIYAGYASLAVTVCRGYCHHIADRDGNICDVGIIDAAELAGSAVSELNLYQILKKVLS